jgi:hypothetical protein
VTRREERASSKREGENLVEEDLRSYVEELSELFRFERTTGRCYGEKINIKFIA